MKLAKLATIKSFNVPSPVGSTIICSSTSALALQSLKDYQHQNHLGSILKQNEEDVSLVLDFLKLNTS